MTFPQLVTPGPAGGYPPLPIQPSPAVDLSKSWNRTIDTFQYGVIPGTDVTDALNALLVSLAAVGTVGATLLYRPGVYVINGQVTFPPGVAWRNIGAGCGFAPNPVFGRQLLTAFRRNTAYADLTKTMFYAGGDTAGFPMNITFEQMMLDGKASTGIPEAQSLLKVFVANQVILRDVVFEDHKSNTNGYESVRLGGAENITVENVWFHDLGSDFAPSATDGKGSGLYIAGDAVQANTLKFTDIEFEGCAGTDLFVGATTTPSQILFSNSKFERGTPNTHPHVYIGQSQNVLFKNTVIPMFRPQPAIIVNNPADHPAQFDGLTITETGDAGYPVPPYFVDVQDGSVMIDNAFFGDSGRPPSTKYVRLAAAAGDFSFKGMVDSPGLLVEDNR